MRYIYKIFISCLLIALTFTNSCTPQKESAPSPEVPVASPTPSPTAARTATATPAAVTTPIPTATAPATAAPSQTPTIGPAAETLKVNLIHSIPLGNEGGIFSAMDDQNIYWIRGKDPGNMFRMPLNGGTPNKVITTKYTQGSLAFMFPSLTDHWIIIGDTPNARSLMNWTIRAVNIDNFSEKIILQSTDNSASLFDFTFDVDGGVLVWSNRVLKSGNFAEDTVSRMNLDNGSTSELFRAEGDQAVWSMAKISKDRVVAEQDLLNSTGANNNIYYFDPIHKQPVPLTTDGQSSMPDFSYPWVIWKSVPRFEFAQNITIHNLETKQEWTLALPSEDNLDPKIDGNFVYWTGLASEYQMSNTLYIYNILKRTLYRLPPAENRWIKDVAIHGQMISWLRIENFQLADNDAYLEWGILDNSIN
jgi:hypothetical protein